MAKPLRRRRRVPPAPAAAVRALRESETRYRVLAEQSSLGIVIHKDFIIRYANPALVTLFGYGRTAEVIGRDLRGVLAPSDRPRVEELAGDQTRLAQMIARGAPLPDLLEALTRMIEGHSDGMLASILLLDPDGVHLRHGAAPSLPASYTSAIDGLLIGPDVGSCGSAAYLGEPVVVSKIDTDARWVPFRELALSHDLRACWSTPIKSSAGRVLGTLALYYREPREPGLWELTLIDVATQLAAIAIEREAVA